MDYKIASSARCAVIGYGTWATALVDVLTKNEQRVGWYVRNAEVLEFIVKPNSAATKCPLSELGFPVDATIGGLVRGDNVMIAVGSTQIQAYDRVVVFAKPNVVSQVGKYFN